MSVPAIVLTIGGTLFAIAVYFAVRSLPEIDEEEERCRV